MKILASASLAASLCAVAFAASGERMIYLHLRMVEGRISLEEAMVVPGRAKVPRFPEDTHQDIRYRVETASGEVWLSGEIEDPSMLRVESEEGGGFQVADKDTVRFVLKIPYRAKLGAMNFFRRHPGGGELGKASANGDFIGGFSLSGVGE